MFGSNCTSIGCSLFHTTTVSMSIGNTVIVMKCGVRAAICRENHREPRFGCIPGLSFLNRISGFSFMFWS